MESQSQPSPLPKFVVLCGIGYNVTVHEGMVIFEEATLVWGFHARMVFERVEMPHGGGAWEMSFSATNGKVTVERVLAAYALLKEAYGGTFEEKRAL